MVGGSSSTPRLIRFGVFELDVRSGDLRKAGTRIPLQEQPRQILALLLVRPGQLITRDELRTLLWLRDTFVDFDHGLNAGVKRLRDMLGDSADVPRFIETVPKRGYRFIPPVEVLGAAEREAVPDAITVTKAAPLRRSLIGRPLMIALSCAAGIAGMWWVAHASARYGGPGAPVGSVARNHTRLTFAPGLQTDVAWAPDGRQIAYASDQFSD